MYVRNNCELFHCIMAGIVENALLLTALLPNSREMLEDTCSHKQSDWGWGQEKVRPLRGNHRDSMSKAGKSVL